MKITDPYTGKQKFHKGGRGNKQETQDPNVETYDQWLAKLKKQQKKKK